MRKKLPAEVRMSVLGQAAPPCEICLEPTSFARFTDVGGKRVGRFAHIRPVADGGPRFDPNYPKDKIDSPENLFWSCTDCHDIIDTQERWPIEKLLARLEQSRSRTGATLVIQAEINVSGEDAENVIGIDAGRKATILKPGTTVNVEGKRANNVIGVKN